MEEDQGVSLPVESNDVDTAHLLSNHDNERRQGRTTNPGDGEELDATLEVVRLADDLCFDLKLRMNVVEVTSCLHGAEAKPNKRLPGLAVAILLDEPAGRFWAKENADGQGLW